MKIEIAKNAGFCFGVDRAVKIAYDCISEKNKLRQNNFSDDSLTYTYGMLIHNTDVTNDLAEKGISAIDRPSEAPFGSRVIIRAHGVPMSDIEYFEKNNIELIDATCPFVKKIHKDCFG